MPERITQEDIASRAGCSRALVSAVLGGRSESMRCSKTTARRIRTLARSLGYHPNWHARALRRGRSDCIGLVLWRERPGPGAGITPFWHPLLGGVEAGARTAAQDLLIIGPRPDADAVEQARRYAEEGRIDALVVPGHLEQDEMRRLLGITAVPVVLACCDSRSAELPQVDVDDADGMRQAVEHLVSLGHRRLLYIDQIHRRVRSIMQRRRRATTAACRAHGILLRTSSITGLDDSSDPDGHPLQKPRLLAAAVDRIVARLRQEPAITALIAASEPLAVAACQAARVCGRRVGVDLAVVGFDDRYADTCDPPLSAIDHMLAPIGEAAARHACRLREEAAPVPTTLLLPPTLTIRASSCPPARGSA